MPSGNLGSVERAESRLVAMSKGDGGEVPDDCGRQEVVVGRVWSGMVLDEELESVIGHSGSHFIEEGSFVLSGKDLEELLKYEVTFFFHGRGTSLPPPNAPRRPRTAILK